MHSLLQQFFFQVLKEHRGEKDIGKILGAVNCSKSKYMGNCRSSVVLLCSKPLEFCLSSSIWHTLLAQH